MCERIVWCTDSMEHFGGIVSRALGAPLLVQAPVGDCEIVHIVGLLDIQEYDMTREWTARARSRAIHWTGQDVLVLSRPEAVPQAVHFSGTEIVRQALQRAGIESAVAPLPAAYHFEVTPLPETPTVSVYFGSRAPLYSPDVVQAVMESLPNVRFVTYRQGNYDEEGMRRLVAETSVHLRLTQWDGCAVGAREYLEAGRRVVTSQPLEHASTVDLDDLDAILAALQEALSQGTPDTEAAQYWSEANADERFASTVLAATTQLGT